MNCCRAYQILLLAALMMATAGCSRFVARRMVQAPNTYPTWFAPSAPVTLDYSQAFLTNFPKRYVPVGPPAARLCYRVVEPADYGVTVAVSNRLVGERREYNFTFVATVPGATNAWSAKPRGTVVLLHGFGLAQFSMAPWSLRLAEEGWCCVQVDLRGHGRSTGDRIYYGLQEPADLSQLLDQLAASRVLVPPLAVMGESYGAAIGLRWAGLDARVRSVIAIAPYASLSNAVLNVGHDYIGWLPTGIIRGGLRALPGELATRASELDTSTMLRRRPVRALFITSRGDTIAPAAEVGRLYRLAAPGSQLLTVPDATHEALTYYFEDLTEPVLWWLNNSL